MNKEMSDHQLVYRSIQGPSWRWRLAIQAAQSSFGCPGVTDEIVMQAKSYVKAYLRDDCDACASEEHSAIVAAKLLWDDPQSKQKLVILTLGDLPREHIAEQLATPLETVTTTEQLFFDIRDSREATSWVNCHVILPEEKNGNVDLSTKYRAAFWGGPFVAQAVLDAEERVAFDEVQRLADEEVRLHMKVRQALDIPLDNQQASLQLIKIYTEFEYKKQRLELLKERFRHRCEQDIRKHELAERRMDVLAERDEARAKAKQQLTDQKSRLRREKDKMAEISAEAQVDALFSQQQEAMERAAKSPLAKLTWPTDIQSDGVVSREGAQSSTERLIDDRAKSAA